MPKLLILGAGTKDAWRKQARTTMARIMQERRMVRAEFLASLRVEPSSLRTEAMLTLRGAGWKLEDIAAIFDLSRERIRQVLVAVIEKNELEQDSEQDVPAATQLPQE